MTHSLDNTIFYIYIIQRSNLPSNFHDLTLLQTLVDIIKKFATHIFFSSYYKSIICIYNRTVFFIIGKNVALQTGKFYFKS